MESNISTLEGGKVALLSTSSAQGGNEKPYVCPKIQEQALQALEDAENSDVLPTIDAKGAIKLTLPTGEEVMVLAYGNKKGKIIKGAKLKELKQRIPEPGEDTGEYTTTLNEVKNNKVGKGLFYGGFALMAFGVVTATPDIGHAGPLAERLDNSSPDDINHAGFTAKTVELIEDDNGNPGFLTSTQTGEAFVIPCSGDVRACLSQVAIEQYPLDVDARRVNTPTTNGMEVYFQGTRFINFGNLETGDSGYPTDVGDLNPYFIPRAADALGMRTDEQGNKWLLTDHGVEYKLDPNGGPPLEEHDFGQRSDLCGVPYVDGPEGEVIASKMLGSLPDYSECRLGIYENWDDFVADHNWQQIVPIRQTRAENPTVMRYVDDQGELQELLLFTCIDGAQTCFLTIEPGQTSPVCNDGILDDGEVCDENDGVTQFAGDPTCESQGYDGGTLGCGPQCNELDESECTTDPVQECLNGVREGTEVCDQDDLDGESCQTQIDPETQATFTDGDLGCGDECDEFDISDCNTTIQPACNNGILDTEEECDEDQSDGSVQFTGNATCLDFTETVTRNDGTDIEIPYTGGDLGCTTGCEIDTSGCVRLPQLNALTPACQTLLDSGILEAVGAENPNSYNYCKVSGCGDGDNEGRTVMFEMTGDCKAKVKIAKALEVEDPENPTEAVTIEISDDGQPGGFAEGLATFTYPIVEGNSAEISRLEGRYSVVENQHSPDGMPQVEFRVPLTGEVTAVLTLSGTSLFGAKTNNEFYQETGEGMVVLRMEDPNSGDPIEMNRIDNVDGSGFDTIPLPPGWGFSVSEDDPTQVALTQPETPDDVQVDNAEGTDIAEETPDEVRPDELQVETAEETDTDVSPDTGADVSSETAYPDSSPETAQAEGEGGVEEVDNNNDPNCGCGTLNGEKAPSLPLTAENIETLLLAVSLLLATVAKRKRLVYAQIHPGVELNRIMGEAVNKVIGRVAGGVKGVVSGVKSGVSKIKGIL